MKKKILKNINKIIIIPTITLMIYLVYNQILSIKCIFYKVTGLYCPGCGITRCIIAIFKLDFYQAFRYNPLGFILLPFIIIYFIYQLYIYLFNKKDEITKKIPNGIYYILLFVLILFGIMRNIDTFNWLAPTKIN